MLNPRRPLMKGRPDRRRRGNATERPWHSRSLLHGLCLRVTGGALGRAQCRHFRFPSSTAVTTGSSGAGGLPASSIGEYMWWANLGMVSAAAKPARHRLHPDTGVPSGSVTAVWWPFQPIARHWGRFPVESPKAASLVAVLKTYLENRPGRRAFDTHEASSEQSVPAGESPPGIYGVPTT